MEKLIRTILEECLAKSQGINLRKQVIAALDSKLQSQECKKEIELAVKYFMKENLYDCIDDILQDSGGEIIRKAFKNRVKVTITR